MCVELHDRLFAKKPWWLLADLYCKFVPAKGTPPLYALLVVIHDHVWFKPPERASRSAQKILNRTLHAPTTPS